MNTAFEWRDHTDALDWRELSNLYRIAPLSEKHPDSLKLVFGNSMFKLFAYNQGQLVAAGRVLADGADCAYICDVAVHPDYQGQGLGQHMVARLVERSNHHKKIILYAVAGKEPFYQKLGFKRMNTAMAIFKKDEEAIKEGLISIN